MKKSTLFHYLTAAALALAAASCTMDAQPAWMKKGSETTVSFLFGSSDASDRSDTSSRAVVQGTGAFYILTVGGPTGEGGPLYGPFEVRTGSEFKTTAIPAGAYSGFALIHSAGKLDETHQFTLGESKLTLRELLAREDVRKNFLTIDDKTETSTTDPLELLIEQFTTFFKGEASIGIVQPVTIEKGKDNVLACTLIPVPSMEYVVMSNYTTCELPCTTVPLRKFVSIFGAIPSPDANSLTITLALPTGTESASIGQAILYGGTGAKLVVLGGGEALSANTKQSVSYSYLQKADQELFLYIEYSGCVSVSASYSKPDGASLTVLNLLDTGNASSGSEIEAIWDRFAEVHHSITVDREDQYGMNFDAMLAAMVELKALPDVVFVPNGRWNATLHTGKLLKDIAPLLKKDGLETAYDKEMLDKAAVGYQGVIPSGMVNTHVMYINNRVLKSCGLTPAKTLDELKAQVSDLASKGKKTLLMANADPWVMQSTLFSDIAARMCGLDWLIKIKTGEKKFTDTDFVASLALVKSLYTDGILGPETLEATYGDVPGPFLNDEYAYYIDGAWRISAIAPAQTEAQQADILLGVFPRISDAAPALTSAATADNGWGISASVPAGSLREEAAWELIKWLEGKEVQEWRVKSFNTWIPSNESVDVSALTVAPIQKSMAGFRSAYELDAPVIDNVLSGAVVDAINSSLQQICNGTLTPEDAAAAIQNAWTTITP